MMNNTLLITIVITLSIFASSVLSQNASPPTAIHRAVQPEMSKVDFDAFVSNAEHSLNDREILRMLANQYFADYQQLANRYAGESSMRPLSSADPKNPQPNIAQLVNRLRLDKYTIEVKLDQDVMAIVSQVSAKQWQNYRCEVRRKHLLPEIRRQTGIRFAPDLKTIVNDIMHDMTISDDMRSILDSYCTELDRELVVWSSEGYSVLSDLFSTTESENDSRAADDTFAQLVGKLVAMGNEVENVSRRYTELIEMQLADNPLRQLFESRVSEVEYPEIYVRSPVDICGIAVRDGRLKDPYASAVLAIVDRHNARREALRGVVMSHHRQIRTELLELKRKPKVLDADIAHAKERNERDLVHGLADLLNLEENSCREIARILAPVPRNEWPIDVRVALSWISE